jgi:hypothetical protein
VTQEISHRQQFAISIDTYWNELCLSLEYQERLYREALGCQSMQVIELAGDYQKGMKRILRFTKPIDAPAAITKLFGSHVSIEEHSQYDAREQCWSYTMVPPMMADRIHIRGRVRIVPQSGSIEQQSLNTVSCKLFGIGAIIEHFVAKQTEQGNADKAAFTRRYIDEKKLR